MRNSKEGWTEERQQGDLISISEQSSLRFFSRDTVLSLSVIKLS